VSSEPAIFLPTQNKPVVTESVVPSPLDDVQPSKQLSPLLNLCQISLASQLAFHSTLPPDLRDSHQAVLKSMAAAATAGATGPTPDLSPPIFNTKLSASAGSSPGTRPSSCHRARSLFDSGAGASFVAQRLASKTGVVLQPLPAPLPVRLATDIEVLVHHSARLTIQIGKRYKADWQFYVVPDLQFDVILGNDWGYAFDVSYRASTKTLSFSHRGTSVCLEPENPPFRHTVQLDPSKFAAAKDKAEALADTHRRLQARIAELEALAPPPPLSAASLASLALPGFQLDTAKQFNKFLRTSSVDPAECFLLWAQPPTPPSVDPTPPPAPAAPAADSSGEVAPGSAVFQAQSQWLRDAGLTPLPSELPPATFARFKSLLTRYGDRFRSEKQLDASFSLEGDLRTKTVSLDTTPDHQPYRGPLHRLSPMEMDELGKQLDKLLAAGAIRPSTDLRYGAPVLFAPKGDGTLRLCCDYRVLNKTLVTKFFDLPRPEDLFNRCAGSTVFSKLDLLNGFNQLPLRPEDQDKTTIRTQLGSFAWTLLPFGLKNGPAWFSAVVSAAMERARLLFGLRPAPGCEGPSGPTPLTALPHFCDNFIDDILIHSADVLSHLDHLEAVLEALSEAGLFIKNSKADFFQSQIAYLGNIISASGVAVDPAKVEAVTSWPVPRDLHELRSFLGLTNFYRQFVNNYAEVTAPLTDLLSPKVPWQWSSAHQAAFDHLKQLLTSSPVLRHYSRSADTLLVTDASKFALGAALYQRDSPTDPYRPVAFYSRKLSSAESNYTTREGELLAIKSALAHWRHYCHGLPLRIHTDHQSLQYINSQRSLSGRLLRWQEFFQDFDITEIKYVRGADNTVADALSRRVDLQGLLLADSHLTSAWSLCATSVSWPQSDLPARLRQAQAEDPLCCRLSSYLRSPARHGSDPIRARYVLHQGLLCWVAHFRPRVVVPPALRAPLLFEAHDAKASAHLGIDKTYNRLAAGYFWPRMFKDVEHYVASCVGCQATKVSRQRPQGAAAPLPAPDRPFSSVGLDLIGPLPVSKAGFNTLVTFVDYTSRLLIAVPTSTAYKDGLPSLTGEALAQLFFDHVFRFFGLPAALHSDRGSQFTGSFWTELFALAGTRLNFSTAFHPQTQGLPERANHTLVQMLKPYIDSLYEDWPDHLVAVQFAYNSSVHPSLGCSPFEALFGFVPRSPLDLSQPLPDSPAARSYALFRARVHAAHDHLQHHQLRQAELLDRRRRPASFSVGDWVLLQSKNISLSSPSKFKPPYLGPFRVTQVSASGNACRLQLPDSMPVHPTFNVDLLKHFVARDWTQIPAAPPALEHRRIHSIVASRLRRNVTHYIVKWVDLPDAWNSLVAPAWLATHPDGPAALATWTARQRAIPATPSQDRAGRNRARAPAPPRRPPPPVAPWFWPPVPWAPPPWLPPP